MFKQNWLLKDKLIKVYYREKKWSLENIYISNNILANIPKIILYTKKILYEQHTFTLS